MSNYVLTRWAFGEHPRIPITQQDYQDIKRATEVIYAATDIERSFDLVVRSFVEFEKGLSSSAVNHMVRLVNDRLSFFHEMQEHLMRLVTLLTTCRMYLDQTDKCLKCAPLDSLSLETPFERAKARHYDDSFSYRLFEALLNFAQHQGQAIHRIAYRRAWVGEDEQRRMQFATDVFVDPVELRSSGIKAKFRDELNGYSNPVDLRIHARHYLERLGDIQASIRSWLNDDLSGSKAQVLKRIEEFEALDGRRDSIGLVAAEIRGSRTLHDEVHLMRHSLQYLDDLQTTNSTLVNLSKRYITSEPHEQARL